MNTAAALRIKKDEVAEDVSTGRRDVTLATLMSERMGKSGRTAEGRRSERLRDDKEGPGKKKFGTRNADVITSGARLHHANDASASFNQ